MKYRRIILNKGGDKVKKGLKITLKILLILAVIAALLFAGYFVGVLHCSSILSENSNLENSNLSDSNNTSSIGSEDLTDSVVNSSSDYQIEEETEDSESIYQCVAICGGVVTQDDGHGRVDIQRKCDYCQKLGAREYGVYNHQGSQYKSNFSCSNIDCPYEGEIQYTIIQAK